MSENMNLEEPGASFEAVSLGDDFAAVGRQYGIRVDYFPCTQSSNDVARDKVYRHGDIVVAGVQTDGRGQRGNKWISAEGENLTFSLVVEPRFLPADRQFLLSEAVSLAVVATLRAFGCPATIKWPNDIYLEDLKVAGILIENDIMGMTFSRSIVGVGINVNQLSFPAGLPNPVSMAGWLKGGSLQGLNLPDVLSTFVMAFRSYYGLLEEEITGGGKNESALEKLYHKVLYRVGEPHTFKLPGAECFTGVIKKVMPTGEIVIADESGAEQSFLFKEVEFVI